MQKPEVIERLRADAAALGLDQAAIDKQWPTLQMQAEQRAAEGTLVRNVNSGAPVDLEFAQTEGQEMWAGEEAEDPAALEKREKYIESRAAIEYTKATKAAERYLSRGVVDSVEEGLKLAFIRAREREEAAALLKHKSVRKQQEAGFTKAELQEIRTRFNLPNIKDHTARKIAYNQRKRKMIDEAGGIEAWNASKAAAHLARVAEAGGEEAFLKERKAEYAALIAEAETASTNEAIDAERRTYYQIAIERADRAIKAKAGSGEADYVESTLEEFRKRSGGGLSEIYRAAQRERSAGGDAWGALVNSSKKPADSRPRV
jgi:large subunit ribosomal protein L28